LSNPTSRYKLNLAFWGAVLALTTGCTTFTPVPVPSSNPQTLLSLLPSDVLLMGEQHDAPEHQQLQLQAVQALVQRKQLAALVLEMSEQGHSTKGLAPDASENQVQQALGWNTQAWPWQTYGPVVMAAVQAQVPVLGGNLPHAQMRSVMTEVFWDTRVSSDVLLAQREAIRAGHCNLLPPEQIPAMVRIQIARDATMARTTQQALKAGQTVLLIAGSAHVVRTVGIPLHWTTLHADKAPLLKVVVAQAADAGGGVTPVEGADITLPTPTRPPRDVCAELRNQWQKSTPSPANSKSSTSPEPNR